MQHLVRIVEVSTIVGENVVRLRRWTHHHRNDVFFFLLSLLLPASLTCSKYCCKPHFILSIGMKHFGISLFLHTISGLLLKPYIFRVQVTLNVILSYVTLSNNLSFNFYFENLTIGLPILYVLTMHTNFHVNQMLFIIVNTKFPNCRISNNWKEIWFTNINLYWYIMSTISISILLQKNTLWFYLLWTWLKQEIFLTLVERWIEWSPQQISSFELIRDLLFFKSLNMKAFRLKFFSALEAWFIEFQIFGFIEVYGGFLA